ncbi:MAG: hypothetical protein DMF56_20565 [Acidobacteria bacterium]|nr:MAG: hypothetical protein DMF56_20565 [Acidobacteriota bacterium]
MKKSRCIFMLAAILIAATAAFATDPVTVTTAVTGDPVPGATVTAKATIVINDGSTLVGVKWTQTAGVPAVLTNANANVVTIALPNRKTFREELIEVLEEPPIADSQLPSYVPPKAQYESGLQNRFTIVRKCNAAMRSNERMAARLWRRGYAALSCFCTGTTEAVRRRA